MEELRVMEGWRGMMVSLGRNGELKSVMGVVMSCLTKDCSFNAVYTVIIDVCSWGNDHFRETEVCRL